MTRLLSGAALLFLLASAQGAASQASMVPEWLGRDGQVLRGEREGTIPDVRALYEAAPAAHVDALEHSLLLCHVVARPDGANGSRWDTFADPDLRITLALGSFRSAAWGTENSCEAWVSFADVSARSTARIEARIFDRDVTGDENIGVARGGFDGTFPFTVTATYASMECRLGDAALAAREATAWIDRAAEPVARAEAATPDLAAEGFGRPREASDAARSAIATAMAFGGLRDTRAHALRARLVASETAFERAASASVRAALSAPRVESGVIPGTETTVRVLETLQGARRIRAAFPSADSFTTSVVVVALEPASTSPERILGQPDVIDRQLHSVVSNAELLRDPADPARIGIAFSTRYRARDSLLRMGTGARAVVRLP